jgi:putative ABC transport system substrate-binding protein
VQLASRDRIPAMYEARNFVDDGGLVSYGPDLREIYRQAAVYAARILKGARPSDLPVEQPRIALVVNRGTARALDLAIPVAVLSRADEILD